jgi:predicted RNA polymerase sigma factor
MSLQESSKRVDGTGPRNPTSTRCTRPTSQRISMRLYAYHGDLGLAQHVVQDAFTPALARWTPI